MSQGCSRQLALLLAALAAAAPAIAAEPIKIGVPIAQSPPGSVVQGVQVKDGLEIVKDMINKQGGLLGQPIALLYEDDQGIPEKGRAAVEKLITRDLVLVRYSDRKAEPANLAGYRELQVRCKRSRIRGL